MNFATLPLDIVSQIVPWLDGVDFGRLWLSGDLGVRMKLAHQEVLVIRWDGSCVPSWPDKLLCSLPKLRELSIENEFVYLQNVPWRNASSQGLGVSLTKLSLAFYNAPSCLGHIGQVLPNLKHLSCSFYDKMDAMDMLPLPGSLEYLKLEPATTQAVAIISNGVQWYSSLPATLTYYDAHLQSKTAEYKIDWPPCLTYLRAQFESGWESIASLPATLTTLRATISFTPLSQLLTQCLSPWQTLPRALTHLDVRTHGPGWSGDARTVLPAVPQLPICLSFLHLHMLCGQFPRDEDAKRYIERLYGHCKELTHIYVRAGAIMTKFVVTPENAKLMPIATNKLQLPGTGFTPEFSTLLPNMLVELVVSSMPSAFLGNPDATFPPNLRLLDISCAELTIMMTPLPKTLTHLAIPDCLLPSTSRAFPLPATLQLLSISTMGLYHHNHRPNLPKLRSLIVIGVNSTLRHPRLSEFESLLSFPPALVGIPTTLETLTIIPFSSQHEASQWPWSMPASSNLHTIVVGSEGSSATGSLTALPSLFHWPSKLKRLELNVSDLDPQALFASFPRTLRRLHLNIVDRSYRRIELEHLRLLPPSLVSLQLLVPPNITRQMVLQLLTQPFRGGWMVYSDG